MRSYLERGGFGEMAWLRDTAAVRLDPARLLAGAGTILALGSCYATTQHKMDGSSPVAPSAQGRDYHAVVRDKLRSLRRLLSAASVACPMVMTCDTMPIQEKSWAARSGLGWIGKSGLLVTPGHGTRVALATVILGDVPDVTDEAMENRCGRCTRCLDACPTGALFGDGMLDARRCIAFHTIESKAASIPEEVALSMSGRVFGCDACQAACPWNRPSHACGDPKFLPRPLAALSVSEWAAISEADFEKLASGTALKRAGRDGIRRNAAAALSASAPAPKIDPPKATH